MLVALDQDAAHSIFQVPDNGGAWPPDALDYLRRLGARRKTVFLAFAPKAAGTFLRHAVIEATGGELVRVVHAQGGRDAQLYYPTLLAYFLGGLCRGPLTAHVHMQALPANVKMLEALDIRPVIMLRGIPDMLASYWDMLDREAGALENGLNCAIPSDWPQMGAADKADFLIDMLGPWYASYYATWLAYGAGNDRVLTLRYEDMLDNPAAILAAVLRHSGLEQPRPLCDLVVNDLWEDRYTLRFNQGVTGRGRQYFSPEQRLRLRRMLGYYGIDGEMAAMLADAAPQAGASERSSGSVNQALSCY